MKSLFLDSGPNVSFSTPGSAPLHYTFGNAKSKGYPFLGAQQSTYGHFVNLSDHSEAVKKLLEEPESATEPPQPVHAYSELLKAEKIANPTTAPPPSTPALNDNEFKEAAKHFLNAKTTLPQNDYEPPKDGPKIEPPMTASLVNELAAVATPKKRVYVARKKKAHPAPSPPKKKVIKFKKLVTSFRVIGKKK